MKSIIEAINSYDGVVDIKKEFEADPLRENRELVIAFCDQIISLYKLESKISEKQKEKIRMGERKGKFSVVSEGGPFTTSVYYEDKKISCVKRAAVSVGVGDPVLRAEAVLNLDASNCDLEIDLENMIISFGEKRFKLVPVKKGE